MDKTPDQLLIKLNGKGVSPETVRASDLGEFIIQFERALLETAIVQPGMSSVLLEREATVSLIAINRGSESLTFAITGSIVPSAGLLTSAIAHGGFSDIPPKAQTALHEISVQAVKRGWEVEFVGDEASGISAAVISDTNPVPAPKLATVRGETTVYGQLIRIGGMTPRAMILLPSGNHLYVDLHEDLAVELASEERLYKEIGLEGVALWRVDTWEIIEFKAERVTGYQPHKFNIVQAFEALATIDGDRWEGVDADQYVADLRGRNN